MILISSKIPQLITTQKGNLLDLSNQSKNYYKNSRKPKSDNKIHIKHNINNSLIKVILKSFRQIFYLIITILDNAALHTRTNKIMIKINT